MKQSSQIFQSADNLQAGKGNKSQSRGSSCIEFDQDQNQQNVLLKDYTFPDNGSKRLHETHTKDSMDTRIMTEEYQWGFPRPCMISQMEMMDQFFQDKLPDDIFQKLSDIGQCMEIAKTYENGQKSPSRTQEFRIQNMESQKRINEFKKCQKLRNKHSSELLGPNLLNDVNKNKSKQNKKGNKNNLKTLQQKRLRNQTKNIVKNYSKAIIKYVGDNQKIVEELFEKLESKLDYHYFNASLQKKKLSISTVGQLYQFLTDSQMGYETRQIGKLFIRKYCYYWIYNSRIEDTLSHLKYKVRIQQYLDDPERILQQRMKLP